MAALAVPMLLLLHCIWWCCADAGALRIMCENCAACEEQEYQHISDFRVASQKESHRVPAICTKRPHRGLYFTKENQIYVVANMVDYKVVKLSSWFLWIWTQKKQKTTSLEKLSNNCLCIGMVKYLSACYNRNVMNAEKIFVSIIQM